MEDKNPMEIIEKMKEWIKKYYPPGYDVYRDYNDRLSPDMILNDLEQKNPMEAFYEHINEMYGDLQFMDLY